MTIERLLTVEEVADLLRTTRSAIYSSRHRHEAPGALALRVGRRLLWRPHDLRDWLSEAATDGQAVIHQRGRQKAQRG